ncbi:MAG: serine hydrolase, partial [Pseudomonadota bacterium]
MWRWLGRGLLALVLIAAAAALAFREEIGRLNAVLTLFDEDRITANFSAMDAAFLTAPVAAGGAPRPLPEAPRPLPERFVHGGGEEGVEAFLSRSATTSLLVLKDGAVAHESYRLGTGPEDLRMSWSVTKSFVASLIGIALAEGDLPGLDAPAEALAPELAGSAYEGVRLRDILNMASGVEFNEDYLDFWSDINQMGRVLALGASMDAFAAGQDRRLAPPGEAFRYVSIDTHVLAMILRRATGRSLAEALSEKIWIPMGAEADARMITDGHGAAFALGGLNARTRDFARFGLLIAEGGGGVVPADWIAEATSPTAPPPADASRV